MVLTLNKSHLKFYKSYESFSRVYTCLFHKNLVNKVCMRTMISSKSFYAIRALFNTAMMLSNTEMVDKINRQNTKPFVESAVDLVLDHDKGVLQHKTAILKHTTNHRFSADDFYEYFCKKYKHDNVHWEPNTFVDCRILNEISVANEYLNIFGKDITWFYATNDQRSSTFPGAKQSNVDFWVYITRVMGINKTTYQDEKSGTDIFRHSTRGSIGLVSFDENGSNIQTMSKPITCSDIITHNLDRLESFKRYLKDNNLLNEIFAETYTKGKLLCYEMQDKPFNEVLKLHKELQNILWKEIQCNPVVDRSLSFVFLKQIVTHPVSSREEVFSQVFRANIKEDKLYFLDKKQDFNALYKAMIYASKEIDPEFVKKLEHLHANGVIFNNNFLNVLADLIKNGGLL